IPAVIYGRGLDTIKISLVKNEFVKLYKKSLNELAFFEVNVGGTEYHTLLKAKQIHPVTRETLHMDFVVVPSHQMIEVDMPIKFVGTPVGTKTGGFIDVVHRTLKIQCLEENLPEDIEVDISSLIVGEALHVHQLPKGNWVVKEHPDTVLITIHAKKVEAQPATDVKVEKAEDKTEV
ncbi:MAG: 50S ribosomal protein L25, partial [Candidatus Cloacimonetes bacterium]|nr:50S ribosomal protein L25 [Candidatus Cloacimonadota bacterium]